MDKLAVLVVVVIAVGLLLAYFLVPASDDSISETPQQSGGSAGVVNITINEPESDLGVGDGEGQESQQKG